MAEFTPTAPIYTEESLQIVTPASEITKTLCRRLLTEYCRGRQWGVAVEPTGRPKGLAEISVQDYDADGWFHARFRIADMDPALFPPSTGNILDDLPSEASFRIAVTIEGHPVYEFDGRKNYLDFGPIGLQLDAFFSR